MINAPQYLSGRRELTPEEQARFVEYREQANMNSRPPARLNDRIAAVAYWAVVLIAFGTAGIALALISGGL